MKDLLSSEAPSADAGPFLAVREHKRLGCPLARLRTPEYAWVPWSTREHPRVRLGTREYAWAPLSTLGGEPAPLQGGVAYRLGSSIIKIAFPKTPEYP